jgi:RHS repeat-associated protein
MAVTHYLWDDDTDTVVMEKDDFGNVLAEYDTDPVLYGRLFSMRRGGTTYNYRYDAQGNTRALTDEAGNRTDSYRYDAWGNETVATGATVNPYRYGGEVGYHYGMDRRSYDVRERTYIPIRGRWASPDPLFLSGEDKYLYARNSPASRIDPSGRTPVLEGGWDTGVVMPTWYCGMGEGSCRFQFDGGYQAVSMTGGEVSLLKPAKGDFFACDTSALNPVFGCSRIVPITHTKEQWGKHLFDSFVVPVWQKLSAKKATDVCKPALLSLKLRGMSKDNRWACPLSCRQHTVRLVLDMYCYEGKFAQAYNSNWFGCWPTCKAIFLCLDAKPRGRFVAPANKMTIFDISLQEAIEAAGDTGIEGENE